MVGCRRKGLQAGRTAPKAGLCGHVACAVAQACAWKDPALG